MGPECIAKISSKVCKEKKCEGRLRREGGKGMDRGRVEKKGSEGVVKCL